MNYNIVLLMLFDLLKQANAADTEHRLDWQEPQDASSRHFYGHIQKAIESIAGTEITEEFAKSSEVDLGLANRQYHLQTTAIDRLVGIGQIVDEYEEWRNARM